MHTYRPNLAFPIYALAQFSNNPRKYHWELAKRVLRYLKMSVGFGIVYSKPDESIVKAYSDATWAS
ncbi:hypothetical protein O6H91_17G038400 [Diphasiastrum complanatum]|uniref:Uncharacterized protein n=1 Tax=Diphasiastrum complanatum TaxID=34168 RepID=A0ACC2B6X3_DIPCM|nr:hypothetical protein O6H91_17G038400 [Diphasiastrum complanatum]